MVGSAVGGILSQLATSAFDSASRLDLSSALSCAPSRSVRRRAPLTQLVAKRGNRDYKG